VWFHWVGVDDVWGDGIVSRGWREEGLSYEQTLVMVVVRFRCGTVGVFGLEGRDPGLAAIFRVGGDVFIGSPDVITVNVLQPIYPVLLLSRVDLLCIAILEIAQVCVTGMSGQSTKLVCESAEAVDLLT
jgi:hypothetical protein